MMKTEGNARYVQGLLDGLAEGFGDDQSYKFTMMEFGILQLSIEEYQELTSLIKRNIEKEKLEVDVDPQLARYRAKLHLISSVKAHHVLVDGFPEEVHQRLGLNRINCHLWSLIAVRTLYTDRSKLVEKFGKVPGEEVLSHSRIYRRFLI